MATGADDAGFHFLFRSDRGLISRATWWRGTLPIAGIALGATLVWQVVRPFTRNALNQPPALALMAYLYLLAFAFGMLILLVCEYNLSAKRFAALGLPRALAAILPASLLAAGTLDWYIPRSDGLLPDWSIWIVLLAVLAVTAWNVVQLGMRNDPIQAA